MNNLIAITCSEKTTVTVKNTTLSNNYRLLFLVFTRLYNFNLKAEKKKNNRYNNYNMLMCLVKSEYA